MIWLLLVALVPAAWALWQYARARRLNAAVEQALSSLSERDYSVRLRTDEQVAVRFNRLAERLRSEQSERYQRELLLEAVLEATPSAVLLVDAAEQVVFTNLAARQQFGGGDRIDGHPLAEILANAPAELRAALIGSEEGLVTVEEGADTFRVAQRRIELRYQPHRLLVVEPLTRELERKEADAWKRAIRVMSHEINNSLAPVGSLVNTSRKIIGRPDQAEKLAQVFDTIADRAQHLQHFLDGYARFARLPRPIRQPLQWAPFVEKLRALYPFTVAGPLPEAPASLDPAQLQQVFVNLLKNAVESGSPPGEIRLAVTAVNGGHELEIRDQGAGMSDEVLRQVLVPFYSTKKSGSGLGLALCREIVEAHGGSLSIRSQPGQGTTVRCYLPS